MIPRRHRRDEFPSGYSLAGYSPAELAAASPDTQIMLDDEPKVVQDYSERENAFIRRVSP